MKHSQHFSKRSFPGEAYSEDWKEKDFPLYNGRSSENRTDRYRGHFQDEIFSIMEKTSWIVFSSTADTREGMSDNDYKSASHDTGCFCEYRIQ